MHHRLALVVVCLGVTVPGVFASHGFPDADVLAGAETAFAEGTALRDDSARARPAFSRAAGGFDELWRRGYRNPDLAMNRASAHRLAGDLPAAIVALNEGLAAFPWHRPLQVALEDARSAVNYPPAGDLATQCRPAPATGVATRVSPVEGWSVAGLLWLLACGAAARFGMTRWPGWLVIASAGLFALAVFAGLWWKDSARRSNANEFPLVVLTEEVVLRKGNSDTYPARLDARLPRGVEARELRRRGGWVHTRLASGAVGWVPQSCVIRAEGMTGQ